MKKEKNGRESLRRLKPAVGCNASKRREKEIIVLAQLFPVNCRKPLHCVMYPVVVISDL